MKKDTGKEKIGVIGGTGLENIAGIKYSGEQFVETPYGSPSDKFRVYENDSFIIYALNRHGANHEYAPHNVNYQANIYGLYSLEVSEKGTYTVIAKDKAGNTTEEQSIEIDKTQSEFLRVHPCVFDAFRSSRFEAVKINHSF